MDRDSWKIRKVSEILGIPLLDRRYLHPNVIIDLRDRLSQIEQVGAAILYGSLVRGEASPKSDIDVMIVPLRNAKPEEVEKEVNSLLRELENEYGLDLSFSLRVFTGNEDSHFLWETVYDGVVIYCTPEFTLGGIENSQPYALISYSLKNLSQGDKKRVQRFLFESDSGVKIDKKNKLEYIAPGVLLFPIKRSKHIIEIFDSIGVDYGLRKVWL